MCIIGAGPAGLSADHYLRERGHRDVTVYEAADRVGGKCYTARHGEHRFDLGAVLAPAGYEVVLDLAEHYGVDLIPCPRHVLMDSETGRRLPLGPGIIDLTAPATYIAAARAIAVVARSRRIAAAGFRDLDADLALPIEQYLRKHRLWPLRNMLVPLFTGYGYGYADEIPMAYLAKLAAVALPGSPRALRKWLRVKARRPARRWFADCYAGLMVAGGYQHLFERMAARARVQLQTPALRVARGADRVDVTTAAGTRTFDKVIFAIDPQQILKILDASDRERELLGQVRHIDYWSLLCRIEGQPRSSVYLYTRHLSSQSRGRPVIISQPHSPHDMCVAYVIGGTDVGPREIERNLAEECARTGARLRDIVELRRWSYFPHVGPQHMLAFHEGMQHLQGQRNTYFTGEFLDFATVEYACRYSKELVREHF